MFEVTFLGSGSWQGVPAPFGSDTISKGVKWGTKDFRFRTSLHIKTTHSKSIIVEITPDIRLQSWKFSISKPDIFLVSHWHWDHLFGLFDLDWYASKNPLTIYANSTSKKWYKSRMKHVAAKFKLTKNFKSFTIDTLKITPFPVHHVAETTGFLFEDSVSHKKVAYLSDFYNLPKETFDLIHSVDAIICDATYLASNINDDATHLKNKQIRGFLAKLSAKEIILANIGSYNGLSHAVLKKKYRAYTIAFDGLKKIYK